MLKCNASGSGGFEITRGKQPGKDPTFAEKNVIVHLYYNAYRVPGELTQIKTLLSNAYCVPAM